MAFGKLYLACLVLVFLCFESSIRCNEIENRGRDEGRGRGEGRRNPYIYKKEEHERRLGTDRGEVRAVPIFRDSRILARDLQRYEVNCFHIEPNSFMLPHASSADHILFIKQGKATVGWVYGQKSQEEKLEKGSVYFIPAGAVFYVINTERSERLVAINLLYSENPYPNRHHESFYIGGGQNPPSALSAFRPETLEAAFNTERGRIQRLFSKQDQGAFASFSREQRKKLITLIQGDHGSQFPLWRGRSQGEQEDYKPFNLENKKPRFSNEHGQLIVGDDEALVKGPLQRQDIGISLVRINGMGAPYLATQVTQVGCVLRGGGRIEIVSPEGAQQARMSEGEGGEGEEEGERPRERGERGEFRVSYQRVEDNNLREGDCFVIPAGHLSVQVSSPNQRLEILVFGINDNERNQINYFAGKNSVLRELRNDLLAASFKEREEEVKKVFESQNEQMFLKGPSGEGSKDVEGWNVL